MYESNKKQIKLIQTVISFIFEKIYNQVCIQFIYFEKYFFCFS